MTTAKENMTAPPASHENSAAQQTAAFRFLYPAERAGILPGMDRPGTEY